MSIIYLKTENVSKNVLVLICPHFCLNDTNNTESNFLFCRFVFVILTLSLKSRFKLDFQIIFRHLDLLLQYIMLHTGHL